MGQLLTAMREEIEDLARTDGDTKPRVNVYFDRAWENTCGRENFMKMTQNGELDLMTIFIEKTAKSRCYGCQYDRASQNDHDYCLLESDEMISLLFDQALEDGGKGVLKNMLCLLMN
jgi:hypothetical protein